MLETLLTKCPVCGSKVALNVLNQYTTLIPINSRNGRECKSNITQIDNGPIDAEIISCTREGCDFVTDTSWKVINRPWKIIFRYNRYWLVKEE